jgi:hypothetical protein
VQNSGVIAARSAPLGVVSDRGSLGVAACRQHRSIEIERDARELFLCEAPEDNLASRCANGDHSGFVGRGEPTRQRRGVREPVNAKQARQQGILDVVIALAQAPEPHDKVNDELQEEHVQPVGDALARSPEMAHELASEVQPLKQGLEKDHA